MSEKGVQLKEEAGETMWREQIKQNDIENQFKGEKYMICWGFVSLEGI